jgi:HK97 gp10 family phage protein
MAGKYQVSYQVRYNRLPKMIRSWPGEVREIQSAIAIMLWEIARPPIGETGNLSQNVDVGEDYVHWRAPYAGFVNFGTRYMAARPFVDEAVTQVRPHFLRALEQLAAGKGL